ncbi:MAG: salicylate synthase [Corynebacteriales bacterium]|uniref:Salicylate synthase n=1 Tax=Williamsia herbipolensis TaxID=1603258 RepID=A0AAU4JZP1_9NOCA|nr:salicylate synthase [Williamsia herbipolensis]MCX6468389.1 salicylate synthase [Mycobacteriales bacterium]
MSLTFDAAPLDTPTLDHSGEAARVIAAWAAAGEFGDHVAYERDRRWTFAAGVRSRIVLTRNEIRIEDGEHESTETWTGEPADALRKAVSSLPTGGDWRVYGWVGFDFCAARHGLLDHVAADAVLAHLIVPEFEAHVDADGIDTGTADPTRAGRLRELARAAADPAGSREVDVDTDTDDYRGRVATSIGEIAAGRYHKVIMSREVSIPFAVDIPATYARGRAANTPARSFLLSLGGLSAAGFSPELVVAVDAEGVVVTEPLAGTRALGESAEADLAARDDLLSDGKEIAEHAMSVRACVDEIASVSRSGSTTVDEFMEVRRRGSVQHLASTVSGRLDAGVDAWDALAVLFPSITASGIPKAPALEAIYRLEPTSRGLYSGAVMTASSTGELEATLALRTIFADSEHAWLRAGAGIVAASTPDREFTETCEKLRSVAPYVVPAR